MKNKNVVLYGVIALVAVVAIAFFTGRIPPRGSVEGTIGGANRYQSQQISDQDVVLKDAQVQAFLQSDLFHKLQTNPELARDMSDARIAKLLEDRNITLVVDDNFTTARRRPVFEQAMASAEFVKLVVRPDVQLMLRGMEEAKVGTKGQWRAVLEEKKFRALMVEFANNKAAELLSSACLASEARTVFMEPRFLELAKNVKFIELLSQHNLDLLTNKAYIQDLKAARIATEGLRSDFNFVDQLKPQVKVQP